MASSAAPSIPRPRLYLATPVIDDAAAFAATLTQAIDGVDIAAVLLHLPDVDERSVINAAKVIVPVAQAAGAAALLGGYPTLVARAGADGAHLTGLAAFEEALPILRPDRIAGIGALETRHDAMVAGEGGADYLLFGEPDVNGHRPAFAAIIERVQWWAEVFEVPCVGFAATREEAAALASAGAEFVMLGESVWRDPRGPRAVLLDAAQAIGQGDPRHEASSESSS